MRKRIPLLLIAIVAICNNVWAQTITVTTTNTPSICYNDGSLTVNATGGTAPYIDSIISGPTNPNLVYPIGLPSGQNHFINLPHGSFTIRVHDAAGHVGTFTASVAGTYVFPAMTLSTFGSQVNCIRTPGAGRSPVQYAISSTGANAGFGTYQSEDTFARLCNGTYWVRMRDSCGNIFTDNILVQYYITLPPLCVNFNTGTATLQAYNGVGPYTYRALDNDYTILDSNTTGVFTGLPTAVPYHTYLFSVTDACGAGDQTNQLSPPDPYYTVSCPYDSMLKLTYLFGNINFPPYVFTCLNCTPVRSDTVYSSVRNSVDTLFRGLNQNTAYYIRLTDRCGTTVTDTITTTPALNMLVRQTACNGIAVYFKYDDGTVIPQSSVDSVLLKHNNQWIRSLDGRFDHLATSYAYDSVLGYIHGGCRASAAWPIEIPSRDFSLSLGQQMDSTCSKVWNIVAAVPSNDYPETYYLVDALHDTIAEQPAGGANGAYFYNAHPGIYTLISDSGCSATFILDSFDHVSHNIISYVNCQGQPVIKEYGVDTFNQLIQYAGWPTFSVKLFFHDSLVSGPDTLLYDSPTPYCNNCTRYIYPTDTGLYTYRVYDAFRYIGYDDSNMVHHDISFASRFDSMCPIDSGTIYVTRSTVPFPYVNTAYKCNGHLSAAPHLTIYGGSIPYTVQVAGVDTFLMSANTAIFPATATGTYDVVAYDNCGISRSFTFTIFDTCTTCGTVSVSSDTTVCRGDSALLIATPQYSGGTYSWTPGGPTTPAITVAPVSTTTYHVSYTGPGCTPATASATVTVLDRPVDVWHYSGSGHTIHFIDSVAGGSGPFTYSWTFGDGSSGSGSGVSHTYTGAGGQYVVTLIVTSLCGSDTTTQTITLTGIGDVLLSDIVTIYPNPNQGTFAISVNDIDTGTLTAEVTDMLGKTVYKQGIHTAENKFDLKLPAGIYLVKVSDGTKYTTRSMSIK
ncbi:MAG: repeat-containing protein [Bacteroidetes bacterium]|nr:repeat-containing protein [Bacteroidota bacterium]